MKKMNNNFSKNIILSFLIMCSFVFMSFSSVYAARTPTKKVAKQDITLENKSDQFTLRSSEDASGSDNYLAETIKKQRAAFEANAAEEAADAAMKKSLAGGSNKCDKDLRACIKTKCGNNFEKCALDGDTDLGIKYDACRTKTQCSAEEFSLFTREISEDIRLSAKLSSYDKVIKCGNSYNDCIIKECGKTFNNCLGKPQGDKALSKCENIAKQCTEQDSGLVSRVGTIFGSLRQEAEKEVKKDEERMYELRDLMRTQCEHLGAMFDERSFDCVYTVNFFAGEDQSTPKASRKAYAGNTFTCMQEWFGINVTTYKENAYRLTKSQTEASSAMLGSGLGTAIGTITSGALDRSLQTQKAKKELGQAECDNNGGKWSKALGKCIDLVKNKKASEPENYEETEEIKKDGAEKEQQKPESKTITDTTAQNNNVSTKNTVNIVQER